MVCFIALFCAHAFSNLRHFQSEHFSRLSQSILLMNSLTRCSNERKNTEHVLIIYPAFLYTYSNCNTCMPPMI